MRQEINTEFRIAYYLVPKGPEPFLDPVNELGMTLNQKVHGGKERFPREITDLGPNALSHWVFQAKEGKITVNGQLTPHDDFEGDIAHTAPDGRAITHKMGLTITGHRGEADPEHAADNIAQKVVDHYSDFFDFFTERQILAVKKVK